jgi:hypothetical protein
VKSEQKVWELKEPSDENREPWNWAKSVEG